VLLTLVILTRVFKPPAIESVKTCPALKLLPPEIILVVVNVGCNVPVNITPVALLIDIVSLKSNGTG